jgi:hypothetical protein
VRNFGVICAGTPAANAATEREPAAVEIIMKKIGMKWKLALAAVLCAAPAAAYTYTTKVTLKFADDVGGAADSGTLVIGNTGARQIGIDDNEIQARAANGGASTLYMQHAGGLLAVGGDIGMNEYSQIWMDNEVAIGFNNYYDPDYYGDNDYHAEVSISELFVGHNVAIGALPTSGGTVCADLYGRLKICSSTRELKKDVGDLRYGLREVMGMRPVSFDWKEDGRHDIGFIAEDADAVVPELTVRAPDGKVQGFNYQHYTAVLTHAVQEQQGVIESLHGDLQASRQELTNLGSELARRDRDVDALRRELSELTREVASMRKASTHPSSR